ncbi:uncharacterized protein LOC108218777 isoform X2 [Daucus carota subsp. sativus]|uniref:uncharacterized protein LOC108218777 isoform X2 n=1 Tax=Daucus carota subsp. sativus TaxID=79200 RepID=UPI0007F038BD|nr:PREDICTED: uncharacterized protein LOC108218777 isoform X2 [Daucus carota subsp. sativus]
MRTYIHSVEKKMDNGGNNLANNLSGLALNDPVNKDSLFQVMKAVEAAEVTIKQQVEENNRLRSELLKKNHELEKFKVDDYKTRNPYSENNWNGNSPGRPNAHQSASVSTNEVVGNCSAYSPSHTSTTGEEGSRNVKDPMMQNNGTVKIAGSQTIPDNTGIPRSSPLTSLSSSRYHIEGEVSPQFNLSAHRLMPLTDVNGSGTLKQFREHEEEIMQLRRHLADYSVKETKLLNEKYVLEKQIANLRLVFDQQQQDLVDAESRAIEYRQYIMEENIRLSYALQEAQQERSTFISLLMPILAEHGFQPQVADAQSIVSSVKVLFKHFQEKLNYTEAKLKESQYQITPWQSDMNLMSSAQSPSRPLGNIGLELVPQPIYANGKSKTLSDPVNTSDLDILARHQSVLGGGTANNLEIDDFGVYSPIASRNIASQSIPAQSALSREDSHPQSGETPSNKQVKFSDNVSRIEMDDSDMDGNQIVTDPSADWASKSSPYAADDPSPSYSPYLPPVFEEPSSSFSEAADDDPLPAVESLQISGEAYPGRELQASGYSINGTTSCNFEWVRHLEDGSVRYIEGAKQPNYLVSADDIDTYLAIEVQPMDDRKRKGELVKVFANEHRKITCEPEMQNVIKKTLHIGHATYPVSLLVEDSDMWESATLLVKRDGFSIKVKGTETSIGSVSEKFSPAITVSIPCGSPTEFSIFGSSGVEHILRTEESSADIACSRDAIVLTLRQFTKKAGDKKKKKGLFFSK